MLGDSGYPLEPHLLTPFTQPATVPEENYDRSHIRTRSVVEHTFGILKSRFRCLHQSGGALQYNPTKCAKIIIACMVLHNLCVKRRVPLEEVMEEHNAPNAPAPAGGNGHASGNARRREFVHRYFT